MYFAASFLELSIAAFLLGVCVGITGALIYVAAYDVVGKDEAISAVAWINVMFGIGYIISGYVTGESILCYLSFTVTFFLCYCQISKFNIDATFT